MCPRPNYHLPMHELTRLAYLDAMGIDTYVSRKQLPAAAPSRKLRVVRRSAPPITPPVGDSGAAALKASLGDASPAPVPTMDTAQAETPATAGATGADIPVFSVVAVQLGGCYWLDEIPPGRSLGQDYTQLLQAICFALGWSTGEAELEQFNWPMARGGKLDQGVDSARGGFAGFLTGRLERIQPQRVILLGELDSSWFDPQLLSAHQVTSTVSAWKMLRQPELKHRAWLDLRALRDVP
jgi:hypothetical protein